MRDDGLSGSAGARGGGRSSKTKSRLVLLRSRSSRPRAPASRGACRCAMHASAVAILPRPDQIARVGPRRAPHPRLAQPPSTARPTRPARAQGRVVRALHTLFSTTPYRTAPRPRLSPCPPRARADHHLIRPSPGHTSLKQRIYLLISLRLSSIGGRIVVRAREGSVGGEEGRVGRRRGWSPNCKVRPSPPLVLRALRPCS